MPDCQKQIRSRRQPIWLLLCLVLILPSCREDGEEPPAAEEPDEVDELAFLDPEEAGWTGNPEVDAPDLDGEIIEKQEWRLLISVTKATGYMAKREHIKKGEKLYITIDDGVTDYEVGAKIQVWLNGRAMTSAPAIVDASRIELLEK